MKLLVACVIGYVVGSIPSGFLLSKLYDGIDLRSFGSNSTGATNVLRTGNKKLALITLLIDALKGAILILFLKFFCMESQIYFAAFCCIVGHAYPIWLMFKGGKGVAASAGIFLVLAPIPALISLSVWIVIARLIKISSIASLALSFTFMVSVLYCAFLKKANWNVLAFSVVVFLFLIYTHIGNIRRFLNKEEEFSNLNNHEKT
jgi:glycerol-3-phosphate acyltransferase PlsY